VIPDVHHAFPRQAFHLGEIHHHAVERRAVLPDDVAGQCHFQGVTVSMQVSALAGVIGNPVAGVELEASRDAHVQAEIRFESR